MSGTFVRQITATPLFGMDLMTAQVAGCDVGYWQAVAIPGPTEDDTLTGLFQTTISQVVGLPGNLVRPMWQRTPPTSPGAEVNWCAVGIVSRAPMDYIYLAPSSDLTLGAQRHEYLYLSAMFYGPAADANAGLLRDGLTIPNNWEYLNQFGIRYYEVGETQLVPYLANNQYIGRCDLNFTAVRQLDRDYPVPTIVQAGGVVSSEDSASPWLTPLPT